MLIPVRNDGFLVSLSYQIKCISLTHKSGYFSLSMEAFVCLVLQKVSEKVGGAEGTKLDDDFREMEKVKRKYVY